MRGPGAIRRKTPNGLVWALVALAAAACGSSAGTSGDTGSTGPAIGEIVQPADGGGDPVVIRGVDPVTGAQVALAEYAGKPIVLNFWASWCPPCREELPALIEVSRKHPEVQLIGVNEQDAASAAAKLQAQIGFDWPSIADPDATIAAQLGVIGMPTTFFLDAEHRVVGQVVGGTSLAGFEEGVALATKVGG